MTRQGMSGPGSPANDTMSIPMDNKMWQPSPTISVIIPVYNEAETLPLLYESLTAALEPLNEPFELLFVDDGSEDGSTAFLDTICEAGPSVKVIRLRRNFGQTAALTAGFDAARGAVIVTMDGDLQNDPADIPRLLKKLDEGYDIVSGWRKDRDDPLFTKALPSKLSNKLVSWLTGVPLHDYGCTLKAYRREVVKGIHLYGELHRYIPAVASSMGVQIAEVEVTHRTRARGKSKYGISRLARGLLDLITLKLLLTYMNRPMQMFGGLGLIAMGVGWLSGFATLAMRIFLGIDMTGNPLLYLTIMLFLAGIQFISLGFLGELTTRTYHETQRKPIYVVREIVEAPAEIERPHQRVRS